MILISTYILHADADPDVKIQSSPNVPNSDDHRYDYISSFILAKTRPHY